MAAKKTAKKPKKGAGKRTAKRIAATNRLVATNKAKRASKAAKKKPKKTAKSAARKTAKRTPKRTTGSRKHRGISKAHQEAMQRGRKKAAGAKHTPKKTAAKKTVRNAANKSAKRTTGSRRHSGISKAHQEAMQRGRKKAAGAKPAAHAPGHPKAASAPRTRFDHGHGAHHPNGGAAGHPHSDHHQVGQPGDTCCHCHKVIEQVPVSFHKPGRPTKHYHPNHAKHHPKAA